MTISRPGSSSSRSWNISSVIRPACGCLTRILAGRKYRTGYSAHQSRNCGLASVSAAASSANLGSPGCRPAAARNWLSSARAARSQVVMRARFSASVNIIHSRLRRPAGSPAGSCLIRRYGSFHAR